MSDTDPLVKQRLDKWLWHARMARTRTLAAKLVSDGHVRVDSRRVTDPSRKVRAGDVLTLALAHATLVIEVADFADKRGGAPEARGLYKLLSGPAAPSIADEDAEEAQAPEGAARVRAGADETAPATTPGTDAGDDDALAPGDDCR